MEQEMCAIGADFKRFYAARAEEIQSFRKDSSIMPAKAVPVMVG